jgi:hypothetical protein
VVGFNRAGFKQGLSPIGGNVTDTGQAGIAQGQQLVSDAYRNALDGVNLTPDAQFGADWQAARNVGGAIPNRGDDFNFTMGQVDNLMTPNLSGENFQAGRQILRTERGNVTGPLSAPTQSAYTQAEGALTGLAGRQAPEVMPALTAADSAYRNNRILGAAVASAKNRPDELYAPFQLGNADFNNTVRFGGRSAAEAGQTPFHDLARAGTNVMGNTIPDSGTAGRTMLLAGLGLGGAGIGGAAGYGESGDAAGAIGGAGGGLQNAGLLAAALYAPNSRAGQAAIQRLLVSRPDWLAQLGSRTLNSAAPRVGGIFGATATSNYRERR